MALREVVTQEDLILYEIMKNPVLFTEFVQNVDKMQYEEAFDLSYYQKEMMCDFNPYSTLSCARAIGKTVSLSALIVWILTYNVYNSEYVVFTVPNKVHLEPVFLNLIRMFRSNSFLKNFIKPSGGINNSDFTIDLLNNAKLLCRIAGQSGTGANVIGLHTACILLDEAGYYPWGTWIELQPTLNTWTDGYRLMTSGVPTGIREKNVLFHCDQENSSYSKHRISAYQNPRFSEEDERKAIEQYGGKESDDFIHFVLGQHGRPVFALFDRSTFQIENYQVYKLPFNGIELKESISEYINKLMIFPGLPDKNTKCLFGIDLGYTEPTAILIMYLDHYGRLRFHGRIQLTKVSYPIQERIIDYLDTKFNPFIIGIDKGSSGMHVIQTLQEHNDFAHKNYLKRIAPIDFSSYQVVGIDSNGEEQRAKTKPFSTSLLQEYTNNHKIIYSGTDMEMITELERMTYTKTATGEIVYRTMTVKGGKKGEDHFTSALLCATMAYWLNTDFFIGKPTSKKLLNSFWLSS